MAPANPKEDVDPEASDLSKLAVCPRAQTNGVVSKDPERELKASERMVKVQRRLLIGAVVFMLLMLLGIGGLVALVTATYKDTYVRGDTTMSNADGQVVGTRAATHKLPLLVAPVLPDDELFSVETIRFKLPGTTMGPNVNGSSESNSEVGPHVLNSVRIARVEKVNRTAVVFYGTSGEEVRVWNGVTTVRLSDAGAEIPVCSADITCAAFQVERAELAEKYRAEAEALLAPFEEGRRRLAAECLDVFDVRQRSQMQEMNCKNYRKNSVKGMLCLVLSNQAKLEENQRILSLNQQAILYVQDKPARLVSTEAHPSPAGFGACGWCGEIPRETEKCYDGSVIQCKSPIHGRDKKCCAFSYRDDRPPYEIPFFP